jgi:SAM-dependent methyltransferase
MTAGDSSGTPQPVYNPLYYEVASLADAKAATVTDEDGMSSEERWQRETPWLVNDISKCLRLAETRCLVDYGCGTGRIAKELIARYNCRVIGVDASSAMRRLSPDYVCSPRFSAWAPRDLDEAISTGFRANFCIAIWVIQHAFDPADIIRRIQRALHPGGTFYALNAVQRCLPTDRGFMNDGFDVPAALREAFVEETSYPVPQEILPPAHIKSLVQVLRKRDGQHRDKP